MSQTRLRVRSPRSFLTAFAATFVAAAALAPVAIAAPPPVVTQLAPADASSQGGDTINVIGHDFDDVTAVLVGNQTAEFDVLTREVLNVQLPAHAAGKVDIAVVKGDSGLSVDSPADDLLYVDRAPIARVPVVSSISAASGPANGGNTLIVNGANLSETLFVGFRAADGSVAPGTNLQRISPTQLQLTVPAGTGRVQVFATSAFHGLSADSPADDYKYEGTPDGPVGPGEDPISAGVPYISRTYGGAVAKIGGLIFLQGKRFRGVKSVTIGGKKAYRVTELFDTFIAAQAPPNNGGKYDVVVTNAKGSSTVSSRTTFRYAGLF